MVTERYILDCSVQGCNTLLKQMCVCWRQHCMQPVCLHAPWCTGLAQFTFRCQAGCHMTQWPPCHVTHINLCVTVDGDIMWPHWTCRSHDLYPIPVLIVWVLWWTPHLWPWPTSWGKAVLIGGHTHPHTHIHTPTDNHHESVNVETCTHHTLHQGGSRKLLSFFSLSEHVVSLFFSTVLLVSLASSFSSSSSSSSSFSFFSPSLSPVSPLLFRSSSVAGGENPVDTHTHTNTHTQRAWGDALKTHSDTAGFKALHTHTEKLLDSRYAPTQPHTHINMQPVCSQLNGDRGIVSLFVIFWRKSFLATSSWRITHRKNKSVDPSPVLIDARQSISPHLYFLEPQQQSSGGSV